MKLTHWGWEPNPVTAEGWQDKLRRRSIVDDVTGCWLHQGAKNSSGYPSVRVLGVKLSVHQASYKAFHDWSWLPKGRSQVVMHSCDVRNCVNPAHLRLGTLKENSQDMLRKGRQRFNGAPGSKNCKAKLNESLIPWIRQMLNYGVSTSCLADALGVSRTTIQGVRRGKFWSHV